MITNLNASLLTFILELTFDVVVCFVNVSLKVVMPTKGGRFCCLYLSSFTFESRIFH